MLRPDEPYMSVNWLEQTGASSQQQQLAIVREHLTTKGMTLPATGRLAVLHLQTVFDHVATGTPDSRKLSAHHEPHLPQDPSHAGIYGYTEDDQLVADLIAEAVSDHFTARNST